MQRSYDGKGETRRCFKVVQGGNEGATGKAPEFVTSVSTEEGITEVRVYSNEEPRKLVAHVVTVEDTKGHRAARIALRHFGLTADSL